MANKKKILIVDDEEDVINFLSSFFDDLGYESISALNGKTGLEKVNNEQPDLITLDITMPEKSGVKMYRELKEDPTTSNIPVVMITGVSQEFERFIYSRKQLPPPEGYLSKPIDRAKLSDLVRRYLS